MSEARLAEAVAVARGVAAEHGLRTDPQVLQDGINVVLHLRPAPVVARVATLTRLLRDDGLTPFGREVSLAGELAAAGAPVLAPSDVLPPGPHRRGRTVLSFWTHVTVLPRRPGPAETAAAFADLHEHLARQPATGLPLDTPLRDLEAFCARAGAWGVSDADLDALAGRLERVRPRLHGELRRLHGDAHPGNLLATPDGWRWTDLEDTCSGPLAWDLACLRTTGRLDGRAALDALPGAPTDAELAPWVELRRLHAAAWSVVHASAHPEAAGAAADRLAAALGGVSPAAPPGPG
ncbi:phosphotransferase [Blastococcus tunisiensis]|uniref:Phosphotransferase enzyme family protein n=1 Tax=Blastococcus tunisiensis TaxID=1798228 RepID=A0A1I1YA27_9ACTN|nr:phosphotransferase [Blastococcus sp. DSM 46838]SFE16436.1 Phosphotransferase enzyme family protein [Blastococcus sp. DSM 46838]